ncbi:MAG: type II secretion system protein [Planctomycetota bacterium]
MSRQRSVGFTLVELLVVIMIIGILVGLAGPAIFRGRHRAVALECKNNLKQLATLLVSVADENGGWFPLASGPNPPAYQSFQKLVEEVRDAKVLDALTCPGGPQKAAVMPPTGTGAVALAAENVSYTYVKSRTSNNSNSGTPLMSDDTVADPDKDLPGYHPDSIQIAYIDTQVKEVKVKDLPNRRYPENLVNNDGL